MIPDTNEIHEDIRAVCRLTAVEYFSSAGSLRKPLYLRKSDMTTILTKLKESYGYGLPLHMYGDIVFSILKEEYANHGIIIKEMDEREACKR